MANKVTVLIDVAVDKAVGSLKSFRTSIKEAEGVGGKFKAGWQSATDSVKANAGALATAAGAALVAFGVKAVGAFTDTAIAAENAGKAIGVSTEDASRWIAVGDDFGLTAEQIATGLGKVATTLDADKWDKYGIATRDASGEARDANQILLDTFDVLAKETNLTERSRLAKELLGKGYASLSPLIGKTRGELEKYLGAVEDGQVVTAEEAKKARDMALAQDALSDAFGEITLAVGSLVAELSPVIEFLADGVGKVAEFTGMVTDGVGEMKDALDAAFSGAVLTMPADRLEELAKAMQTTAKRAGEMRAAVAPGIRHLEDLERAADRSGSQVEELADSVARLRGELDQEQAALDFEQAIDEFGQAMLDAKGDTDAQAQALITVKGKMLDYLATMQGVPVSKQTEIVALIDAGKLQEAEKLLNDLARVRTATVLAGVGQFSGSSGSGGGTKSGKVGVAADGGVVTRATLAMIGEAGPEAVVPLSQMPGASPLGTGARSGGTNNVTVNITANNPQQAFNDLQGELRRRGIPLLG